MYASCIHHHVVLVHGAGGGSWEWKLWLDHHNRQGQHKYPYLSLYPCHLEVFKYGRTYDTISTEDYTLQIVEFIAGLHVDWNDGGNRLVLVGASMGGVLITQACDSLQQRPYAMIFVCTMLPLLEPFETRGPDVYNFTSSIFPNRIPYESSSLQSTVDAMPGCDPGLCEYVHRQWRDESGLILNALYQGVLWRSFQQMRMSKTSRYLVVIPGDDEYVSSQVQLLFAQRIGAKYKIFPKLLHMGPLFSPQTREIADFVFNWLSEDL